MRQPQIRPDRRWFLNLHGCDPDTYGTLVDAASEAVSQDLYIEVDETDEVAREVLRTRGFVVHRVEDHYVFPTDPAQTGLAGCHAPTGIAIVSAAGVDVDRWRELDDALRQDVPGCAGWRNDPAQFNASALGDPEFDPETYLIAVDEGSGEYVGLVRVWITASAPRLGLIATLASYRRRGLARALLAEAFGVLHGRGQTEAVCEIDRSNDASRNLMRGLGARPTGVTTLELVRPGGERIPHRAAETAP